MFPGSVEWLIAFRYLRPRRADRFVSLISLISLAGIALGVGTLIVVMSVMNGFRYEIIQRIVGINGHASIHARSGSISDVKSLRKVVDGMEHVVSSNAIVDGQALVISKAGGARGALVRGIAGSVLANRDLFANGLVAGSFDDYTGDVIMIGQAMADRLSLVIGDKLTLVAPTGHAGPFGTLPRLRAYPISGIFKLGMYNYDNGAIFMPLQTARRFFSVRGEAQALEVILDHPENAKGFADKLSSALGRGFRAIDWRSANGSLVTAIEVERVVMFLILSLIIVVAAFNIISTLIMLVKDKTADIAILRTMGASRGTIVWIFFLSGSTIGCLGVTFGLVIGLAFAHNVERIRTWLEGVTGTRLFDETLYFLSRLPSRVETGDVTAIAVMALVLSFLATIYPAWRAARIDPVEALRYE